MVTDFLWIKVSVVNFNILSFYFKLINFLLNLLNLQSSTLRSFLVIICECLDLSQFKFLACSLAWSESRLICQNILLFFNFLLFLIFLNDFVHIDPNRNVFVFLGWFAIRIILIIFSLFLSIFFAPDFFWLLNLVQQTDLILADLGCLVNLFKFSFFKS
jgi:hypothetical protein